jgi:predicted  nucleic acid-binding Zn-ribbon protein
MSTVETQTEELKKEMGDLDTKEKSVSEEKKGPKKKAVKKTSAKKVTAKKSNGHADENVVTLKQLCKDMKLDPRVARRRLRAAEMKAEGRWSWPKGSGALAKVEKALAAAE